MRNVLRNSFVLIGILVFSGAMLLTQDLRLGKDLRGGTSLVYAVQLDPGDDADQVMSGIIDVLKNRIDPRGQFDISIIRQGQDRIEITMPAANKGSQERREAFDAAIEALSVRELDEATINRLVLLDQAERTEEFRRIAGEDAELRTQLEELAAISDEELAYRTQLDALPAGAAINERDRLIDLVARAQLDYERTLSSVIAQVLHPEDVIQAFELEDRERVLIVRETNETQTIDSNRKVAIDALKAAHDSQKEAIEAADQAYQNYINNREGLDDASALQRLVARSGVLTFRMIVNPVAGSSSENTHPEEERLRQELRDNGPDGVESTDARWYKLFDTIAALNIEYIDDIERFREAPAAFGLNRGLVLEPYGGEYYVLLWDRRGLRLTQSEGAWSVTDAFTTTDQVGKPAIGFEMDTRGGALLGELTEPNVGQRMAILLDDQMYSAPNLNSRISRSGIIQGDFPPDERDQLIRTLKAGSLQAKLSSDPISINTVGPELGQDNLDKGMIAGIVSLSAVSLFMVLYYFVAGGVAVFALLCNALLIMAAMALSRAAFTLPGIAGLILTFGMAVDANVLIYERIREEIRKGNDLRIAAKLGFKKAMSSIVDGNVTNLIVCFVLANVGTQEIKGFAITLGVGVVCTLVSSLFISRLIFVYLVDYIKLRKLPMLPTVLPGIDRALEPKINWMGLRWPVRIISTVAVGLGIVMIAYQGSEMLDAEFRGGTQVTLELKRMADDPATEIDESLQRETSTRQQLADRLVEFAADADPNTDLASIGRAEIIVVNPQDDGVTSDRFAVKTYITDKEEVTEALLKAFEGLIDQQPPVSFRSSNEDDPPPSIAVPVTRRSLGDVIGQPEYRDNVAEYRGGVAIVVRDITPPLPLDEIEKRIATTRGNEIYSSTLTRASEVIPLETTDGLISTFVLLTVDPALDYTRSPDAWASDLQMVEWTLIRDALASPQSFSSVQNFSPAIAETFQARAIVAVALSLMLILIYIWARFGSVRYSLAAIVCLIHDVLACVGLIALAEIIYEFEGLQSIAQVLLIEPFKIDLTLVAAILTIIGYSLNDTIIILDRIRENRGKLPFATTSVVNLSINQTISRTVITSGTTFIATLILYIEGGQGVRAFSYALLIGIVVGTYSSIAVAAPLVWSGRDSIKPVKPERVPR
jgi:SecD/SecF fusion protein